MNSGLLFFYCLFIECSRCLLNFYYLRSINLSLALWALSLSYESLKVKNYFARSSSIFVLCVSPMS